MFSKLDVTKPIWDEEFEDGWKNYKIGYKWKYLKVHEILLSIVIVIISELFWLTEMFHSILESSDQVESDGMWAGVLGIS